MVPQVSMGRRELPQWMVLSKFILAEGSPCSPHKFWSPGFLEPERAGSICHCVCD